MTSTSTSTSTSEPLARLPPHLSPDRDIHVIISTLSGRHDAQSYFDTTLKPTLDQYSISHQVHVTTSATSIIILCQTHFITAATKGVKQTILLLSGDGGTVDIINTISTLLMRDTYDFRPATIFVKPVICLFPLGTANSLAWSSGAASDPISTMLHGRPRPLPMFEASFSSGSKLVTDEGQSREDISSFDPTPVIYGVVVCSWGLHASLVFTSDTAEYRKHGIDRFKMAAEELLKSPHIYRGTIKLRRERYGEWEDLKYPESSAACSSGNTTSNGHEHIYILAPLVPRFEQYFVISPASEPLTSQLRLLAITPPSPDEVPKEMLRIMGLAYDNGKHISDPSVTYTEIDGLRIDMREEDEEWRMVCVDGKNVAVEKGGWVEVKMLPGMGMDGRRVVEVVVPT